MGWGCFGQAEDGNEDSRQQKGQKQSPGPQWHGGRGVMSGGVWVGC